MDENPERLLDWPLPQERRGSLGHDEAEEALRAAMASERVHHAWLILGERGIGKASLAYRFAHALLARSGEVGADPLSPEAQGPTARLIAQNAHPDLHVLSRRYDAEKKKMKTAIAVEDTRSTLARLTATTADGGYRVVIVDAVDDLNASSANALLKMLEEPPGKTVFLLIGHRPGAVMPTIRSRCRSLILRALDTDLIVRQLVSEGGISRDVAQTAAALCGGSLRRAIELSEERNQKLATRLLGLLSRLPSRDPGEMHAFSDSIAQGGEEAQDLMLDLIGDWLHRRITGATEPVAFGAPVARPPLAQWSEVWDKLNRLSEETDTYNLDRKTFVMLTIEELAAACR